MRLKNIEAIWSSEKLSGVLKKLDVDQFQAAIYQAVANIPMQAPIATPAADFKTSEEYGLVSYIKTALWMYMLEGAVGKQKLDQAFKNYFKEWKHKHPQPLDMKNSFERTIGGKLDVFFWIAEEGRQTGVNAINLLNQFICRI
jgi:aminopeptidase N